MKIFEPTDPVKVTLSVEKFSAYYNTANVVSTESVASFLSKIKDGFNQAVSTFDETDKSVQEAISSRHETVHLAKTIKMVNFRHTIISKPESFGGLYVEYMEDMIDVSGKVHASLVKSITHLKIAIASFINEYTDDKVDTLYGNHYFKQESKVIEQCSNVIGKYFKQPNNKVRTTPDMVLKSMSDFNILYTQITTLGSILNLANIKDVEKSVKDITDLIDALIEQNLKSGILTKSTNTKKELIDAIHQTAKAVEFFNVLYSNLLFFCTAFKSLTDALKAQDSKDIN